MANPNSPAASASPAFFFGRSLRSTWSARSRSVAFDLSLDGKPVPWSDSWAARMIAAGDSVEKIEFVVEQHPHYPDETVTRRRLVETLSPPTHALDCDMDDDCVCDA